jgi:hypothetical protein
MNEAEIKALGIATSLLDFRNSGPDNERGLFYREKDIESVMAHVSKAVSEWTDGSLVDIGAVRAAIEDQNNVVMEDHGIVAGTHKEAWITPSAKRKWHTWKRYRNFLAASGRPAVTLAQMDELTDQMFNICGDPKDYARWQAKGLVYGDIQSGKTSTLVAVVAKGIDSGASYCIVLTGGEEDLRVQTQTRLDEGVIGHHRHSLGRRKFSLQTVGVGLDGGQSPVVAVTSIDHDLSKKADFADIAANPSQCVLLAVKKDPKVLLNVFKWICARHGLDPNDPATPIDRMILIADDESDWGSADTAKRKPDLSPEDHQASTINMRIRALLKLFDRSMYVGFSGTPFANLLSDVEMTNEKDGDDLFPRDFIANLPAPTNYLGVNRLVGASSRRKNPDDAANDQGLLELLKAIPKKDGEWLPSNHKLSHAVTGPVPPSLREAVLRFLIVSALRNQTHNTMLVNLTRYQIVQDKLRVVLDDHVRSIANAFNFEDPALLAEMRNLYENDVVPNCHSVWSRETSEARLASNLPQWTEVLGRLAGVIGKIVVKAINGTSSDVLMYRAAEPAFVIAVGGNKLSRGLTLEGLSVSYFGRLTDQFDTGLQMGRWFGYRDGYLALCRLYARPEAIDTLELMADVTASLRADIVHHGIHTRPGDMCLTFRHTPGKRITARNKQQNTVLVQSDFSGRMPETKIFDPSHETRVRNDLAVSNLLRTIAHHASATNGIGDEDTVRDHGHVKLWRDVDSDGILEFLDGYSTHPDADLVQSQRLRSFIAGRLAEGDSSLGRWNVALMSGRPNHGDHRHSVGGIGYTPRLRTPDLSNVAPELKATYYLDGRDRYVIKRVATAANELVDVTAALVERARTLEEKATGQGRALIRKKNANPDWTYLREARETLGFPGLLLLYPIVPTLDGNRPGWEDAGKPYWGFAAIFAGQKRKTSVLMTRNSHNLTFGDHNV